jgi:hypothetical protein
MSKESLTHIEDPRRLLFRETFNSEQGVKRNGGTPTDVVFSEGKGSFNGTTSNILYNMSLRGTYTVRMVFKSITPVQWRILVDFRGIGQAGSPHMFFASTTTFQNTDGTEYIDNVETLALSAATKEIVISGVTIDCADQFRIGANINDIDGHVTAEYELLEIYNYALTAEEVSNLYEGKRFHELGVHGEQLSSNLVSNTGTPETTDWVDTDADGLADDWVHATGTGTNEIVTGNGFTGNAQRINHVTGTITRIRYDLGVDTIVGKTYTITAKYRNDVSGFRIYLRIGGDIFVSPLPTNTGDATTLEYSVVSSAVGPINCELYCHSAVANGYLEIDEILVTYPVLEETSEILNVSAQSGSITEKHTGDETNLIPNTYSWPDDDDDGVPNGWSESAGSKATPSIVTGNGFNGNAFRYSWDIADELSVAYISYPVDIPSGWGVRYEVKYRTVGGVRFYVNGATLEIIESISVDQTGDAEYTTATITAVSNDKTAIWIYLGNDNNHVTGDYFEIDELIITKIRPDLVNTATTVAKDGEIRAMLFDGATSKIDCGDPDDLTGDKTFVVWFKIRKHSSGGLSRLIDNGGPNLGTDNRFSIYTYNIVPGRIYARNDTAAAMSSSSNAYKLNEWSMLVLVRPASGSGCSFYINGVDDTLDGDAGTPAAGTQNIIIGNCATADRTFNGLISDVRIIDGLLSAAEISQLFSNERSKYRI